LKGNFHDQFLEGWVGAIPPGYSAGVAAMSSSYPTRVDRIFDRDRSGIAPEMTKAGRGFLCILYVLTGAERTQAEPQPLAGRVERRHASERPPTVERSSGAAVGSSTVLGCAFIRDNYLYHFPVVLE
jgi:hypothetical protein